MSVNFQWTGTKAIVEGHEYSAIEALELANQFAGNYGDIVRVARMQMKELPDRRKTKSTTGDLSYSISWPGKAALNVVSLDQEQL
jgi:hypothetical protein